MKYSNKIVPIFLFLLTIFTYFASEGMKTYIEKKNQDRNSKETATNASTETVIPTITPQNEELYTFGWTVYNNTQEYFNNIQEGVLAKAKELGIYIIVHNQNSDTEEMVRGSIELINQGVDALIISPFNPEAMGVIVESADKAGIPVIVVDVGNGGTNVVATIISDNFGGGVMAADYAIKLIKDRSIASKNMAIIKVKETSQYARRRGDAFKLIMEDSGYQLVSEITANSSEEEAYEAMKEILKNYSEDLAVVFCENDPMAIGAARAIDEAGKKGEIFVIGFNGDQEAIQVIKEGLMQGTITQEPFEMGALGVEIAYNVINGISITYDDRVAKELYIEVHLIDETGKIRK